MSERFDNYNAAEAIPDSPQRPARVTLTKEQKQKAARRANYACLPLAALMAFGVGSTQAWGLLLVFVPLLLIINLGTWAFFLHIERIAAERKLGLW